MNRSIIIALLLLSPLFVTLQVQTNVLASLVSSTATQTITSYVTLTGTGEITRYQTFKKVSSIQTMTGTTYTTTGATTVAARVLTTELVTVVVVTNTGGTNCNAQGQQCVGWDKVITVTDLVPQVGWVMVQTRSRIVETVTNQLVTNVPTTLRSTSASTSTYSTGQVEAITATQTFTSVSEQAEPSISDMLSQNLWIILVLGVVVLGVLAFSFARRGGTSPSGVTIPSPPTPHVQGAQGGIVYCLKCGTQNPATNEFCGKCGTKLG